MVDFNAEALVGQVQQLGASLYTYGVWFFIIVFLGIGIGLIMWYLSYKHVVVLRMKTKHGNYIVVDKAKTSFKNEVPMWKLFKLKREITPPPPEAIEITKKGIYHAEAYLSEESPEPIWIKDTGDASNAFEPFPTQERSLQSKRVTEAITRKKKGLMETLVQLAMPIALVMIVLIVFSFWGEMTAPIKDLAKTNAAIAETQRDTSKQLARITAVLAGELEAGNLTIEQVVSRPPPELVME